MLDLLEAVGATVVGVPLPPAGLDPAALRAALAEYRPVALYLQPRAHNPTGVSMTGAHACVLAAVLADFPSGAVEIFPRTFVPGVDDDDAAAGTAENQGGGESGCAAADDDHVIPALAVAGRDSGVGGRGGGSGVVLGLVGAHDMRVARPYVGDNGCCCSWERRGSIRP
jgi:hypothetical protein